MSGTYLDREEVVYIRSVCKKAKLYTQVYTRTYIYVYIYTHTDFNEER